MRDQQIHKEVRWALWLTLLYIIGWAAAAYCLPNSRGWLGFPLWFEAACLYAPLAFIGLMTLVVKFYFKNIDLENKE